MFCAPCTIDFTPVVRFESLSEEGDLLKRHLGLAEALPKEREAWRNANSPERMQEEKLTQLYFRQLNATEVERLYRLYEDDFVMFGYTFEFQGRSFPQRQ